MNRYYRLYRCSAALAGVLFVTAAASASRAGGFEIPETGAVALGRGGAWIVGVDDASAIALNPGGLRKLRGTSLLLNHTLTWEHATFTRAATTLPQGTDYGFDPLAPVSNGAALFPLGAGLFAASDLGLEDWTFGVGVYGPNAHGQRRYPVDGGQRYMLTRMDALMLTPSLAVAYGDGERFGVGVSLQYVLAPSLNMNLVVDGSPGGGLHAYYSGNDVEARIHLSDLASFSMLVGGFYRPTPALEFGVSSRVVPANLNLRGDFSLGNIPGQTQFSDENREVTGSAARLDLTIPMNVKGGLRYRHLCGDRELFDVELNVAWENWSAIKRYKVELDGEIHLFVGAEAPDTVIEKRWRDTLSVRLGGSWNVLDEERVGLALSGGVYWENGAVPAGYEHLDFLSFQRVGLGLGVRARLSAFTLNIAYSHVFQEDREVSELKGKVYQQRPLDPCPGRCDGGAGWSGVPSNSGRFESSYDLLSLGLGAAF